MSQQPGTNRQVPDQAILDHFNKQSYLGNRYNFAFSGTGGGSEAAVLLLQNPALVGASFPNSPSLFVDLRRITGATASDTFVMSTYLGPTVSAAGTAKTPTNLRPASPNASIAALHSGPTVSPNGTLVEQVACGAFQTISSNGLIVLDPGKSLLVTVNATMSAAFTVELDWYEI